MPERRNCGAIPCSCSVSKGTEKNKRCQRGSEFRCVPAVAAFAGKLVAEVAPDHHGLIIDQFDDCLWPIAPFRCKAALRSLSE
jgi:hypothetical protein